jgi:hypothetical protein
MATTVEAMEKAEKRIVTKPATRAILSKPGRERKVTDALKRIAAFRDDKLRNGAMAERRNRLTITQVQAPTTNMGATLRSPLSSSSRWC